MTIVTSKRYVLYFIFLFGVFLTVINIYGLTQNIRPEGLSNKEFRFDNDLELSFKQATKQVEIQQGESDEEYSKRLVKVIASSLAHVPWKKVEDVDEFHQRIPAWENYFLYAMSIFTNIPEYRTYHFANYSRSLERGIGNCGDASMVMSQLLDNNSIDNLIVSFPGHVILTAQFSSEIEFSFDPDFGVFLPYSLEDITNDPMLTKPYYLEKGYSIKEVNTITNAYSKDFVRWSGVKHFITKKYYFEKVAYWLKWPLPLILIFISVFYFVKKKK